MFKRLLTLPVTHTFFLFGPRQTGKSTLIQGTFPAERSLYIDLLQDTEYSKYIQRPSALAEEVEALPAETAHIIIDEVQRVPALLDEVHALIHRYSKGRYFCLSGSSARKLKSAGANLLAGRAWTFNLFPLTHIELGAKFSLDLTLRYGSLPPVYAETSEVELQRTLRAYVDTYLKEEIQRETEIRNFGGFLRFLQVAADLNGELLNFSDIGRESGVSYQTVRGYYQVLEDTLLGRFLLPYSSRTLKRLKRAPKFYLFDLGVKRAIEKKLTAPLLPKTAEYGRAFEHFLVNEILNLASYRELELEATFFRTAHDAEVDLLVKTSDGRFFAIEIKAGEDPGPAAFSGLKAIQSVVPNAELFCACNTQRDKKRGNVRIVPWREMIRILGLT